MHIELGLWESKIAVLLNDWAENIFFIDNGSAHIMNGCALSSNSVQATNISTLGKWIRQNF